MVRWLLLLLALPLPSSSVANQAEPSWDAGVWTENGAVRTDGLGAALWEAPGALSSAECERIRAAGASVKALDGSKMFDASSVGNSDPKEIRSVDLQFLGHGREEVDLLRKELFSVAKRVARKAGWIATTGRLRYLENLQVGIYKASDGGHSSWHSDQDWGTYEPDEGPRLLTVVVMLSPADDYQGGQLQVGLTNATKAQVCGDSTFEQCCAASSHDHQHWHLCAVLTSSLLCVPLPIREQSSCSRHIRCIVSPPLALGSG